LPSCVQTSCSASLAPQTAPKRCRVTVQGFHRCRRKVTCRIRGCCANSRKKHVFTDPRNDHSKLRCAVFFAAGHLDDLRGVCSSRRQRQAECVKPQTLKTATQCMVLGTVSATGVTSQLLNLSYLQTPKVSMTTSSNAAAQKPLQPRRTPETHRLCPVCCFGLTLTLAVPSSSMQLAAD